VQRDIRAALRLIRDRSEPRYWDLVTGFRPRFEADAEKWGVKPGFRLITINDASRSYYGTNSVHAGINRLNREENVKWLAGHIVHESMHGRLFDRGENYMGEAAERAAMQIQLAFLRAVDASRDMQEYLRHELDNVARPDSYWRQYENGRIP
jgi:hypothetical protein